MMGPEVDMNGKLATSMGVSSAVSDNGGVAKLPEEKFVVCASNREDLTLADTASKTPEESLMICASNCEDTAFHMEASPVDHDQVMASGEHYEDVEVDILENVVPDEETVVERESLDVTENSSSFGCTDSEIGTAGTPSDVEVDSQVRDDNASFMRFDGFTDFFRTRKKKLTPHWRKFIHPLMWRCRWLELQIRKLRSQASNYDRKLAECDRRKQCELEKYATEDLGVKSAPFVCQYRPGKVMKRKKRKRVEETVDLASYTSSHSLFSYYARKKSSGSSAYLDDDHGGTEKAHFGSGELGVNGEWLSLEFKDSDGFETTLQKIEEAQAHVRQLRERMDKMVRENAEKFTSVNLNLSQFDPLTCSALKSVLPHVNGEKFSLGSRPTTSQQPSEEKLVMPESAVSGYGEVNPLPDSVGTTEPPQIPGNWEMIENEKGVCNRPVKEESNTEEVGTQCVTETQSAIDGKRKRVQDALDPNSPSKTMVTREQPTVKLRSISKLIAPKNKRKRGRRKARAGRWSRRSSG